MYNLRYHIASLVSVFLALSVGLLLGTIVVDRGIVSAQRTSLVASINKNVETVNAQNRSLKSANDALTAFGNAAAPQLLADKLAGRTILVLADPESGETVSRVQEALRLSGANTAVTTLTGADLGLGDPKAKDAALAVLGSAAESELETRVVETLAREWTTAGDARPLTSALAATGALKQQGLAADAAASGVVLATVFGGTPDPAALRLAAALTAPGRFGAGVEISKSPDGQAKAAVAAGMSGVDDGDTPMGQVSLTWVLLGRAAGSYGTVSGVDGPFPNPLFPGP